MFHQKQEGWDDNEQGRALLFFRSTPEMLPLSLAESKFLIPYFKEKSQKPKKFYGGSMGRLLC